jgi:glycyl-tRNA synthetase beta chain
MKPFLLEIGTEEIPARFVSHGISALKNELVKFLHDASIDFRDILEYATPRRLALLVEQVSEKQQDRQREVLGPSKKVAFDEKGHPTGAALGFAKANNAEMENLTIVNTERGEYVAAIIREKGRETGEVLRDALPKLITSLQFPKTMRWGTGSLRFARPIRWITALIGDNVIPFEVGEIKSSNITRGHRFLSTELLTVKHPSHYLDLLRDNFVIADPDKRKQIITEGMKKVESSMNVAVHADPGLLEIVTFLVEYPTVIVGDFDSVYLTLPKELLITTMKSHQKYFSVEDKNGKLLPYFIVISNSHAENSEIIKKGAERVIRARLEDARFYYLEDQQKPLWDHVRKLKDVTFQESFGNLYDKIKRIALLCSSFADLLNIEQKDKLHRAAMLSKADLVTGIVREFPELQGYMGMIYAINSGEDREVASAIYEHYLPRYSGDSLPSTTMSALISLADKMDNISSFFQLGIIPTGSEDPFALRRQAIGIITILQNSEYPLSLDTLIDKSLEGIKNNMDQKTQLHARILNFFNQRLEWILLEEGYRHDFVAAILSTGERIIKEIKKRMEILVSMTSSAEFPELLLAAKRVYNILARVKPGDVNEHLFSAPQEKELFIASRTVEKRLSKKDYQALFELKDPVNAFFDNVLVMDKNPEIKKNRLALLLYVKKLFSVLGNFSKITSIQ